MAKKTVDLNLDKPEGSIAESSSQSELEKDREILEEIKKLKGQQKVL